LHGSVRSKIHATHQCCAMSKSYLQHLFSVNRVKCSLGVAHQILLQRCINIFFDMKRNILLSISVCKWTEENKSKFHAIEKVSPLYSILRVGFNFYERYHSKTPIEFFNFDFLKQSSFSTRDLQINLEIVIFSMIFFLHANGVVKLCNLHYENFAWT
jgi:hypothetical protein